MTKTREQKIEALLASPKLGTAIDKMSYEAGILAGIRLRDEELGKLRAEHAEQKEQLDFVSETDKQAEEVLLFENAKLREEIINSNKFAQDQENKIEKLREESAKLRVLLRPIKRKLETYVKIYDGDKEAKHFIARIKSALGDGDE